MNFFFDRCLPPRLARMLDEYDAEHTIVHQDDDDRFASDTSDIELIKTLSSDIPKPVLITRDLKIRRNPLERAALAESELSIIFLRAGWGNLEFHNLAVKLLKIWPQIVQQAIRTQATPTAFEITPAARKVQRIGLTTDLLPKRRP